MYSAQSLLIIIIPNGGIASIPADLVIQPPSGTYAKIASRGSLSFDHNVHVIGDNIDYKGNIKVGLCNNSTKPFTITSGDRIVQVILDMPSYQILRLYNPYCFH